MKTWLLLSLLFFPVVICFQGIDKLPTSVELKEGHEEKLVEIWNGVRRDLAKKVRISNMWKLEWSDDLVQTAKSLPADCNSLKPGSNYRFTFLPKGKNEWYKKETEYLVKIDKEYGVHTSFYGVEWFIPEQRTMGCTEYKCNGRISRIPKNPVPTMNFGIICLFGPESSTDIENLKKGEAGSKCEEEGGEDEDGLCVPSGSSDSSILFNFSIMASLVFLVSMVFD
ncbi:unnamed protein product [Caenorhabditis brenneri]